MPPFVPRLTATDETVARALPLFEQAIRAAWVCQRSPAWRAT
jgi:hypothetical protein